MVVELELAMAMTRNPLPMPGDVSFVDVHQGLHLPEVLREELVGEVDDPIAAVVTLTVRLENLVPVCDEITVRRLDDGPPITAETIRRIPLAQWVHLLMYERAYTSTDGEEWGDLDRDRVRWVSLKAAPDAVQERARGQLRRRVTDELLERVAETYRENLAEGAPTKSVARQEMVSHSTAARYVAQARSRGLLGPTTAGKAGESTTEKEL